MFSYGLFGSQSKGVRIVTMLRTGRSRVRIPEGARDFSFLQNVLTGSGYWGSFPGIKRPGREVTLSLYLVLRLGMSGGIPLLPLYALSVWTVKTLYHCGLFNDVVDSSGYVVPNIRMVNELYVTL
jgi:hypothetical protein